MTSQPCPLDTLPPGRDHGAESFLALRMESQFAYALVLPEIGMSGLVLFVDNDMFDVARLVTHLKLAGFRSRVVHSAVAAKERIVTDRPLLVVIDALVTYTGEPPQNASYAPGLRLAEWLRDHLPRQAFILRSAIRDLPWAAAAAATGIELVSKPTDPQQLIAIAQSTPRQPELHKSRHDGLLQLRFG